MCEVINLNNNDVPASSVPPVLAGELGPLQPVITPEVLTHPRIKAKISFFKSVICLKFVFQEFAFTKFVCLEIAFKFL